MIGSLKDFKNTGKTVTYFFVNTDGTVVVRSSSDYIPKMIDIAGGKYIFRILRTQKARVLLWNCRWKSFMQKQRMQII